MPAAEESWTKVEDLLQRTGLIYPGLGEHLRIEFVAEWWTKAHIFEGLTKLPEKIVIRFSPPESILLMPTITSAPLPFRER